MSYNVIIVTLIKVDLFTVIQNCTFILQIYVLLVIHSVYQTIAEKQRPAMVVLPEAYTENTLFYWDENV